MVGMVGMAPMDPCCKTDDIELEVIGIVVDISCVYIYISISRYRRRWLRDD